MKNLKGILFLTCLIWMVNSFGGDLVIQSSPKDCEVFLVDPTTGKKTALGKTPYESTVSQVAGGNESGSIQIEVHKPGFIPYHIALPSSIGADVKLFANLEVEKNISMNQDFDLLVGDLFDVLRMVRVKDYKNSFAKLEKLEKRFPHFSIIFEMKGMVSYLQRNYKEALNFYRKSFGLNPKNREAYRMKVYLEKKFKLADGGK